MQNQPNPIAPATAGWLSRVIPSRMKLPLIIAGGIAACLALALVAVNLLISADWVRDRVAARIKEETGRDLKVNGTTALLFTPGPRIVITDATITDPEARAGTADFSISRLSIDLSLGELLSRQIDAERVVLERPVLTLRLGSDGGMQRRSDSGGPSKPHRFIKATAGGDDSRRDITLRDVRIEDGTVNLVYENGKERRIERIEANLSLPAMTDPFTGQGQVRVEAADGRASASSLPRPPIFATSVPPGCNSLSIQRPSPRASTAASLTRPSFSGQGELSAKANSIPSLLAWMRERPAAEAAIGDGELASHLAWKEGEDHLQRRALRARACERARPGGRHFHRPRPHVRAALALDHLDLNPFLAQAPRRRAAGNCRPSRRRPVQAETAPRRRGHAERRVHASRTQTKQRRDRSDAAAQPSRRADGSGDSKAAGCR